MARMRHSLAALLLMLVVPLPAWGGEAIERLDRFTTGLSSFSAGFVQIVYDEEQRPVQESHGQAWLQRPGLFRWEYETPYQQTIVADGERLWIYDEDLDQVTVKKVERALGTAPIMLLSRREPLEEQFEIMDRGKREGLYWVELQPRVDDTDFRRIFLGFDDQALKVMELRDRFDQATQIRFHHVRLNPELATDRFEFTPPAGVDVIGQVPGAESGGG